MKATAVIGCNFGDEGKGLMTDYLSDNNTLVVRFNGGAQAGHTVVGDGFRHVFHHFGSGSMRGASTYLSEFFIVNPLLWEKELKDLGWNPNTYVHPNSIVTTPYDMLLNQQLEESRSKHRHGSCGIGINETVTRCDEHGMELTVQQCFSESHLRKRLKDIRIGYLPRLVERYGLKDFPYHLLTHDLEERFSGALRRFCSKSIVETFEVVDRFDSVVFEGAQGLLLDETHAFYPYVTRSRTGLDNVLAICSRVGIDALEAIYVTRSYMTRHGAGPFPSEDKSISFLDDTNNTNQWQGKLRFGSLDKELMRHSIQSDLAKAKIEVVGRLAVTHLDQCGSPELPGELSEYFGLNGFYVSNGPTRNNISSEISFKAANAIGKKAGAA